MRNLLFLFAFVLAGAAAFTIGNVTAARSAATDISAALGQDPKTGLAYLRVFVVNSNAESHALTSNAAASGGTMTLGEGSSVPLTGTLLSASAQGRPCDLMVFQGGQSQIIRVSPSGTSLANLRIDGTVSATGNPMGYRCSVVLRYTIP